MVASVRLGPRTDMPNYQSRQAELVWQNRWAVFCQDVSCHYRHLCHSRNAAARIRGKLLDDSIIVTREQVAEAHMVQQRHGDAIEWHHNEIHDRFYEFNDFWRNRPLGTDEWLKKDWWAYSDGDEEVIEAAKEFAEEVVCTEMLSVFEQRNRTLNLVVCPF